MDALHWGLEARKSHLYCQALVTQPQQLIMLLLCRTSTAVWPAARCRPTWTAVHSAGMHQPGLCLQAAFLTACYEMGFAAAQLFLRHGLQWCTCPQLRAQLVQASSLLQQGLPESRLDSAQARMQVDCSECNTWIVTCRL